MTGDRPSQRIGRRKLLSGCAVVGIPTSLLTFGDQLCSRQEDDWQRPTVEMVLFEDRGLPSESVLAIDVHKTNMGDSKALIVEKPNRETAYRPGDARGQYYAFGPISPLQRVRVWAVRGDWRTLVWDRWVTDDGFKTPDQFMGQGSGRGNSDDE